MDWWLILLLALGGLFLVYCTAAWVASGIFFDQIVWRSRMRKGLPFPAKGAEEDWARYNRHMKDCIAAAKTVPYEKCRITAQDGELINDGGHALTPEEILHIDWLCDRVQGSIPSYDELLPFARSIVRLQGIYREKIPPEKDGVQL